MNKKDKLIESTLLALEANTQINQDKTTEENDEVYKKGLNIRDEIVNAWKNNDLETAWNKWEELYDLFGANSTDSNEQRQQKLFKLISITNTIEDKCVYDVTDYGKRQAYKNQGYEY